MISISESFSEGEECGGTTGLLWRSSDESLCACFLVDFSQLPSICIEHASRSRQTQIGAWACHVLIGKVEALSCLAWPHQPNSLASSDYLLLTCNYCNWTNGLFFSLSFLEYCYLSPFFLLGSDLETLSMNGTALCWASILKKGRLTTFLPFLPNIKCSLYTSESGSPSSSHPPWVSCPVKTKIKSYS